MTWIKKILNKSNNKQQVLEKSLKKSNDSFFQKLTRILIGKKNIDDDLLDKLEEILISSDVGVSTTIKVIDRITERAKKEKYISTKELNFIIREEIKTLLKNPDTSIEVEITKNKPFVIIVVGVNGVGKTTTIAKLANKFKTDGLKVLLGAADTFRAAAINQLFFWSERINIPIIKQEIGSDPASVAFNTVQCAVKQKYDVVLIDTAGRLHNKSNLMNELSKINRVIKKIIPNAPHEILLVLDASTGQNAFEQTKKFSAVSEVSSLAITKLDGTAKGGVAIGISEQFNIPIRYIGTGEKLEDLEIFDKSTFVESLFKINSAS